MKPLAAAAKAANTAASTVKTNEEAAKPKLAKIKPKNLIQTTATIGGLGIGGGFLAYKLSKSPVIAGISGLVLGVGAYFLDLMIQTKLQGVGSPEKSK